MGISFKDVLRATCSDTRAGPPRSKRLYFWGLGGDWVSPPRTGCRLYAATATRSKELYFCSANQWTSSSRSRSPAGVFEDRRCPSQHQYSFTTVHFCRNSSTPRELVRKYLSSLANYFFFKPCLSSTLPMDYMPSNEVMMSPTSMQPPPRTRKKAPTLRDADWDPHQVLITELYTSGKTLKDVIAIVKAETGFHAEYLPL